MKQNKHDKTWHQLVWEVLIYYFNVIARDSSVLNGKKLKKSNMIEGARALSMQIQLIKIYQIYTNAADVYILHIIGNIYL